MVVNSVDNWVPKQERPAETPDLRGIGTGPKGFKERNETLKRKMREREEEEDDGPAAMEEDPPQDEQSLKRRKAEGAKYIPVRGRDSSFWKEYLSESLLPGEVRTGLTIQGV